MLIITVESVLIGFNKLLPRVAYYVLQENPFKSSTNYSLLTLTFIITSALCQKGNKLSFNVCQVLNIPYLKEKEKFDSTFSEVMTQ